MSPSHKDKIKRAVIALDRMKQKLAAVLRERAEPIAVIGLGCRFPGAAKDPDAYWRLLCRGGDSVGELAEEQWSDTGARTSPDKHRSGRTSRFGGFLSEWNGFDNAFFDISAPEAIQLDPRQRLLMEVTWETLEHATISPTALSGSRTGVFVGLSSFDAHSEQIRARPKAQLDGYTPMAIDMSAASGRISHMLGLQGPSMVVDTACASSSSTVHLACQSLRLGECDLALAAGVHLLSRRGTVILDHAGVLSPRGRCSAFDRDADGYVRGEGCGVVLLERLSAAQKHGHRILAVIRGSAVNHNGHSGALTVPNGPAQAALIRRALDNAQVRPDEVSYVEAHGTGTSLGDPIEAGALGQVFGAGRRIAPLLIGSVKGNIGHLEPAAGIAGLIKVILALQHEEIPRQLHFDNPSPHISWDQLPIQLVLKNTTWPIGDQPRIAGVSSFGLSGSGVHIVVQEAPPSPSVPASVPTSKPDACERPVHLLALSGKSERAVVELARRYAAFLRANPSASLADVCFSANAGRAHFSHRMAAIAESSAELQQALADFVEGKARSQVAISHPSAMPPRIGFVMGPPEPELVLGLTRKLYQTQPGFAQEVDRINQLFARHGVSSVVEALQTQASTMTGDRHPSTAYMPVYFTFQCALVTMWRSWGIEPSIIVCDGPSDFAAAFCAGVLGLEDAVELMAAHLVRADTTTDTTTYTTSDNAKEDALTKLHHLTESVNLAPPAIELVGRDGRTRSIELNSPKHWRRPILDSASISAPPPAGPIPSTSAAGHLHGYFYLHIAPAVEPTAAWRHLLKDLAALYMAGVAVNWATFDDDYPRQRLSLPTYPFERQTYRHALPALPDQHTDTSARAPVPEHFDESEPPERSDESEASVLAALRQMMASLLMLDANAVDAHTPLIEQGADSLVVLSAQAEIKKRYGVEIDSRALYDAYPTLAALARHIAATVTLPPTVPAIPMMGAKDSNTFPKTDDIAQESQDTGISAPAIERIMARQLQAVEDTIARQLEALAPYRNSKRTQPTPTKSPEPQRPERRSYSSPMPQAADNQSPLSPRQERHLSNLIDTYTGRTAGSKSRAAQARVRVADRRNSWGFRPSIKELVYPIYAASGQGSRMIDIDGNEYIDLSMGFGVHFFGHDPAFVREALRVKIDSGFRIGPRDELADEVAERIARLTGMERVAFFGSGTEAVMSALRLARTATGKPGVAMFRGAYHGHFDTVLAGPGPQDRGTPMYPGVVPNAVADTLVLAYGDDAALEHIESQANLLAAILVEPVQTAHPDVQPVDFLRRLRALASRLTIPLIFDEIVTGFRCHIGGAQRYFDISADIAIYGKAIAGGLPIGIVAGKADYLNHIDGGPWSYGDHSYPAEATTFCSGTFNKHPLAMAATAAVLDQLEAAGPALQEQLNQRTAQFARRLQDFFAEEQLAIDVAYFSSFFRFVHEANLDLLYYHLLNRGIYIWEGRRCFLSTAHSEQELRHIEDAVRDSIAALRDGGFLPPPPGRSSVSRSDRSGPFDGNGAIRPPRWRNESESTTAEAHGRRAQKPPTRFALTVTQKQFQYLAQTDVAALLAYQDLTALRIRGPLDIACLEDAVRQTVARHEMLRVAIDLETGSQEVHEEVPAVLAVTDLSKAADRETRLQTWLEYALNEPLDLTRAPIWRCCLLVVGEHDHILVFITHQITIDGFSTWSILREVSALYTAAQARRTAPLPKAAAFSDWHWHTAPDEQSRAEHEAFWLAQLSEPLPTLDLIPDRPRPPLQTYASRRLHVAVDDELAATIGKIARKQGTTLFTLLLSAYAALLHRLCDERDVLIGVPVARRIAEVDPALAQSVVGPCLKILPLRLRISPQASFARLLSHTRDRLLEALDHRDYSYTDLLDKLPLTRDPAHMPVVSTVFNYEDLSWSGDLFAARTEVVQSNIAYHPFDISVHVVKTPQGLRLLCDYNSDLFDRARVRDLCRRYVTLLGSITEDIEQPVAALALLSDIEKQALLNRGRGTGAQPGPVRCIHQLFAEQAARTPDLPALAYTGSDGSSSQMRYGELARRVWRLAHELRRQGVRQEVRVAIAAAPGPELVIGVLAILEAGGAFLPLDCAMPDARKRAICDDAGVALIIDDEYVRQTDDRITTVTSGREPTNLRRNQPDDEHSPEQLAYIVYTSGSTGQPKGILVEHRQLAHYLSALAPVYGIAAGLHYALVSTFAADLGFTSVFFSLTTGGCLHLLPPDTARDPETLGQYIANRNIDVVKLTPSHLRALLTGPYPERIIPRHALILGGEACPIDLVETVRDFGGTCRIFNAYGPAETTIEVAVCEVGALPASGQQTVSLGRPMSHSNVYLLDTRLQPVPDGVEGEIYIGGQGVARGYASQPRLTAETFLADPYSSLAGARLYRTGDRARYRQGGELEFLGRHDQQVKIRGFRVELSEIDSALSQVDEVTRAVTIPRQIHGHTQIVAYVEARHNPAPSLGDKLRRELQSRLPGYMIPRQFVLVDRIPLTGNGKVHYHALTELPLPTIHDRPHQAQGSVSPRTARERALASIWAQVLGVHELPGIHDNFFAIGGDSIQAMTIVTRARRAGMHFTTRHLLQHPTVAGLAKLIDTNEPTLDEAASSTSNTDSNDSIGPIPLTPVQRRFFELYAQTADHHNLSLLFEVANEVDTTRLEQSLGHVVRHHGVFSMRFAYGDGEDDSDGEISQHDTAQTPAISLDVIELNEPSANALANTLYKECSRLQARLNLSRGPVAVFALFRLPGQGHHRLLLIFHHLFVDAVSARILLEDLSLAYQQLSAGQAVQLPPHSDRVHKWAQALQDYAGSAALSEELPFWLQIRGSDICPLPLDSPQNLCRNVYATNKTHTVNASKRDTQLLVQKVPAASGANIEDVLLCALVMSLADWLARDDDGYQPALLLLDMESHGRQEHIAKLDLSRTVGWFTCLYPLVLKLDRNRSLGKVLRDIQTQRNRIRHAGIGYGVLRYLSPDRDIRQRLSELPSPALRFNYLGRFDRDFSRFPLVRLAKEPPGAECAPEAKRGHILEFDAWTADDQLHMTWTYSGELHRTETIIGLANDVLHTLNKIIAAYGPSATLPPAARAPETFPKVLPKASIENEYPLSPLQEGLLFHSLSQPDAASYINQLALIFRGPLNAAKFRRAWQDTVARHAVLRTGFRWQGDLDRPMQTVFAAATLPWTEEDWRGIAASEQKQRLVARLAADRSTVFQLERPPLMRMTLLQLDEHVFHWTWTHHHLILDRWSAAMVLEQVFARYRALRSSNAASFDNYDPPPYRDYIHWLDRTDQRRAREFWASYLRGFAQPTPFPAQSLSSHSTMAEQNPSKFEHLLHILPKELNESLPALAQHTHVTLNIVFQGAWACLLSAYTNTHDVVFGATQSGRTADLADVDRMIGPLINTLPVRALISHEEELGAWLQQLLASQIERDAFGYTSLGEIQRCNQIPSGMPLFHSLLVFESYPIAQDLYRGFADIVIDDIAYSEPTHYPLTLLIFPGPPLRVEFSYNSAHLDRATVARVARHLTNVLASFVAHPKWAPLRHWPMDAAEQKLIVNTWNRVDSQEALETNETGQHREGGSHEFVHRSFEIQAEKIPHTPALVWSGGAMSYAEVDARANRLAGKLSDREIGPETLVGLCLEHGPDIPVAILGVFKAGAAYIPLDPDWPEARLAEIVADAAVGHVLISQALAARVPRIFNASAVPVLIMSVVDGPECSADLPEDIPRPRKVPLDADNAAYVMYTSGSTGRPKGVCVTHKTLSNLVTWQIGDEASQSTPHPAGCKTLQFAAASFDVSLQEIFSTWCEGGTLVVPSAEERHDPVRLLAFIRNQAVERLFLPYIILRQLALTVRDGQRPPDSVRQLIVAGEPLRISAVIGDFLQAIQPCTLHNHYGPSETHVVTAYACSAPDQEQGEEIPIGRTIAHTRIYLLDDRLRPVPLGAVGEVYIAGRSMARGYLGHPALTAQQFIPDPFCRGQRLYKSGDLARYLPSGDLLFVGRRDEQDKIHGVRFEPGEIEHALRRHPDIREAAATVCILANGDQQLVAYVVGKTINQARPRRPTAASLRSFVANILPRPLVPAAYVFVDKLPLTSGGKLDRGALPAPAATTHDSAGLPLDNPFAEILAALWAEVLGPGLWIDPSTNIGANADFFALGGNSLSAVRLIGRINHQLGISLSPRAIFEHPTIAALAALVERMRSKRPNRVPSRPISKGWEHEKNVLSFTEKRLWTLQQLEESGPAFNLSWAFHLQGPLEVEKLTAALRNVVGRHHILRTTYMARAGRPRPIVAPNVDHPLAIEDLTHLSPGQQAIETRKHVNAWGTMPFDLAEDRPLRALLLRRTETDHVLFLALHHIAADAYSVDILFRELAHCYQSGRQQGDCELPALPLQYRDFARWQQGQSDDNAWNEQQKYWRNRLLGAPPLLSLPADRPHPTARTWHGNAVSFRITGKTTAGLDTLARQAGATRFMTLLAVFLAFLHRYTGRRDLLVGVPVSGRDFPEIESIIGCFVNLLVIRQDVARDLSFAQLLTQVRETTLDAFAHRDIPFDELVRALAVERQLSHPPLVQVGFTYLHQSAEQLRLDGVEIAPIQLPQTTSRLDLNLAIAESKPEMDSTTGQQADGELHATFEYNSDIFDHPTVLHLTERFQHLLDAICRDANAPLQQVPQFASAQTKASLHSHRDSRRATARMSIQRRIWQQANQCPDAPALVSVDGGDEDGPATWSYEELIRLSHHLGQRLLSIGLTAGTPIALYLARGLALTASRLAILAAGGAFVVLERDQPRTRLAAILHEIQPQLLLTDRQSYRRLSEDPPRHLSPVFIDDIWPESPRPVMARAEQPSLPTSVLPDQVAYIAYTSGSSAGPKGVMTTHRGVCNYLDYLDAAWKLGSNDTVLQLAAPGFDASIRDTLAPLTAGAQVILPSDRVARDPWAVLELIRSHCVTALLSVTPSLLTTLLAAAEAQPGPCHSVRLLLLSGEVLRNELVTRAQARLFPAATLVNQYGPTETTMTCTYRAIMPESELADPIAIGEPIANTQIYLLDGMEPVAEHTPGEICIAGPGLARGYLNRPRETAAAFVPDPYSGIPGARMYRTGDLARTGADGELFFVGRMDRMLKVRGIRVEVAEIESVLDAHPQIDRAAVIARAHAPDDVRLLAHIQLRRPDNPLRTNATVATGIETFEPADIRAFCQDRLPSYMIPAEFRLWNALPQTTNGKVDYRALAETVVPAEQGRFTPFDQMPENQMPESRSVRELTLIWQSLLNIEDIPTHANFFELGGHSLLAVQVCARVRVVFGLELSPRALFRFPTLAGLAQHIDVTRQNPVAAGCTAILRMADEAPVKASYAQERLWFLYRLQGPHQIYNISVATALKGRLDRKALERALVELITRHEPLRTIFPRDGGTVRPTVCVASAFALERRELPSESASRQTIIAREQAEQQASRPFDLETELPFRATLLMFDKTTHILFLTVHHIAADAWSIGIVQRELSLLYHGLVHDNRPSLPPLAVRYRDYAHWQRQLTDSPALHKQRVYWKQRLADAPQRALFSAQTSADSCASNLCEFALTPGTTRALHKLARDHGCTLFITLLTAFATVLGRETNTHDLVIGTPVANRDRVELESLVGLFVNILALRICIPKDLPQLHFSHLLESVNEYVMEDFAHRDLPFEQIVAMHGHAANSGRSPMRVPLIQVTFLLHNEPLPELALSGLQCTHIPGSKNAVKYDLSLRMAEEDGALRGQFTYRADLDGAVHKLAKGFTDLIEAIVREPNRPLFVSNGGSDRGLDRELDSMVQQLAAIWAAVLNVPHVDPDDNFFALGGHSLLSMHLVTRIEQEFATDIPLATIFAHPTPRRLAEALCATGFDRTEPMTAMPHPGENHEDKPNE